VTRLAEADRDAMAPVEVEQPVGRERQLQRFAAIVTIEL
jgi:hypothetical protein